MMPSNQKYHYAKANTYESARVVLFGANTNKAGHASSAEGILAGKTVKPHKPQGLWSAEAIRNQELFSRSLSEHLIDGLELHDAGDLILKSSQLTQVTQVKQKVVSILADRKIPICLGGDHLIKYAGVSACSEVHGDQIGVVYIDAHPDCRPSPSLYYDTVLYRLFEERKIFSTNCTIVGLRESTQSEAAGLLKHEPNIIYGSDFHAAPLTALVDNLLRSLIKVDTLYLSIDPDGLNPSEAPAVEQAQAGGPFLDQIIALSRILIANKRVVAIDISEHVPRLDTLATTATAMSRLIKECYAAMTSQHNNCHG